MDRAPLCTVPEPAAAQAVARASWKLTLLDGWRLEDGRSEAFLRMREQRVIALLALHGSRNRSYLSGVLWPDSTEARACGNLRSAVWQIERTAPGLLRHEGSVLDLAAGVRVDVRDLRRLLDQVCGWTAQHSAADRDSRYDTANRYDIDTRSDIALLPRLLRGELLPGWYDDWVLLERTTLQQVQIQALEVIATRLLDRAEPAGALLAASAAAALEPLRESAHRVIVSAHLRQGNLHLALREYRAFRRRVIAELGVPPTDGLESLVRPFLGRENLAATLRRAPRADPA